MFKKNTDFRLTEMTIHISRQVSKRKMGDYSLEVTAIIPVLAVFWRHG